MDRQQRQVVIVGAGPTGLAAANLLGQAGIDTLLIERLARPLDDPRAISIDDEGLRICQAMGLRDEVLSTALLDLHAHYLSGGHYLAKVAPIARRNGYPLISSFHQPTFEKVLLAGLNRFSSVEVLFGHTLLSFEQDEWQVHLIVSTPTGTQQQISCSYLLACDGGKSAIRHALDIPLRPITLFPSHLSFTGRDLQGKQRRIKHHSEQWLVVDCIDDDDPTKAVIFFCDCARPAVTVPAPGKRRRWEFMLLPGEQEKDLLQPDIIQAFIKRARDTQHSAGKPPRIARQAIYTFHAALATQFSQGRIFLLGDAAHLMPPFGGQGMNSGLRDAHNLCWKLRLVLQGDTKPELLATYQQERAPHAAQMILFSSILGKLIMPVKRSLALVRDIFFRGIVNTLPPLRTAITEMRVKPQPPYTTGCLLPTSNPESKQLTGKLLPQPYVLTQTAERILLDDLLGNTFTLLRLYEKPEDAFAPLKHGIWERLGVRFVCIQPAGSFPSPHNCVSCTSVVDSEQKLCIFFGYKKNIYILVRPDRYIMAAFRVKDADRFAEKLENFLYQE